MSSPAQVHIFPDPPSIKQTTRELKSQIEMTIMQIFSNTLTTNLYQSNFRIPKSSYILKQAHHPENEEISVFSTTASSEAETLEEECTFEKDQFLAKSEEQSYYGKKRMKYFLDCFSKFEDMLVQSKSVNKVALQKFKSCNRQFLKFCFDPDLRCQQADSICLSIFLLSSNKSGLSKKIFVKEAKKLFKNRVVKISRIRKSRCYASVKKLSILVNQL